MRKYLTTILLLFLLIGCSTETDAEKQTTELQEKTMEQSNKTNETEKEIYINILNDMLDDYAIKNHDFDRDVAEQIYWEFIEVAESEGLKQAKKMKEHLIKEDTYYEFYNRIIDLEETFSHVKWSD